MNIIFPLGGIGERFQKVGYRYPKPLISVVGRPMLYLVIDNLTIESNDVVFVVANQQLFDTYHLLDRLRIEYPHVTFKSVVLEYRTWGAAETLTAALAQMTPDELQRRTISLDCDCVYRDDVLGACRTLGSEEHATFFFVDEGDKPIFSYIEFANSEVNLEQCSTRAPVDLPVVVRMVEKERISNFANSGAYCFASGATLARECRKLLDIDPTLLKGGEFYTSTVYQRLLEQDEVVRAIYVNDFAVLGTPAQLDTFLENLDNNGRYFRKKLRFCFDLDLTLVTPPKVRGDYSSCQPVWPKIRLVRRLHSLGQYIIIQTARRMATHKGNVGRVIRDVGMVTMNQLKRYNIPYDELIFGKPHAHVYVDDLAVNAYLQTNTEIGLPVTFGYSERQDRDRVEKEVKVTAAVVEMRGSKEVLNAQVLFHQLLMNESVRDMFPELVSVENEGDTVCMRVSVVRGQPFSRLLLNKTVTRSRLRMVMNALHKLHTCHSDCVPLEQSRTQRLLVAYAEAHDGHDGRLATVIHNELDKCEKLGVACVHGHCVLSNVLFDCSGVHFVSMKADVTANASATVSGDMADDLSLVLCCLYGLEMNDENKRIAHDPYMASVREWFWEDVEDLYDEKVSRHYIELTTAGLMLLYSGDASAVWVENARKLLAKLDIKIDEHHEETSM